MKLLRHIAGSFVIFAILIGLFVSSFDEMKSTYSLTETDIKDGENIGDALVNLNLISGINQTATEVHKIATSTNAIDLVGALLSAGIGVVKASTGLIILPVQIMNILVKFYAPFIPGIVRVGFLTIFSLYFGLILLRYFTRTE